MELMRHTDNEPCHFQQLYKKIKNFSFNKFSHVDPQRYNFQIKNTKEGEGDICKTYSFYVPYNFPVFCSYRRYFFEGNIVLYMYLEKYILSVVEFGSVTKIMLCQGSF